MNFSQKHERLAKIISYTTPENFLESLSAIEYSLLLPSSEEVMSLVPNEANFQLPNIFLKTRNNFEVEKLFGKSRPDDNWNSKIDKLIGLIDQIELKQDHPSENGDFDEKTLEVLIKHRHCL